jgi:tryptophan synthase beta chain
LEELLNVPTKTPERPNDWSAYPDAKGRFGDYGGLYVAETLMPLVLELDRAYTEAKNDPSFQKELAGYLTHYVGRPSPLYFAERPPSISAARRSTSSARS